MATMTETPKATSTVKPSHDYHAHAQVLSGHLQQPFEEKIESQAPVKLADRRGGHFSRQIDAFSLEGLISFTKGQTRVSGARSLKNNGWVTLSTSIVEDLKVFEIITADRIVAQISTEHAYENGHVPHVTFLGTQFENVQVSGFPVELILHLGLLGDRPANDRSYLRDPLFLERVREQTERIAASDGLPKTLRDQYDGKLRDIRHLIDTCDDGNEAARNPITCSLVQSIGEIPIPGVHSFGHILVIPEFGSVALGEVEVGEKQYEKNERPCVYFEFRTIQMNLGCVGHGSVSGPSTTTNGNTRP